MAGFYVANLWLCSFILCFPLAMSLIIRYEDIIKDHDITTRPEKYGPVKVNVTLLINTLEIDDRRQMLKLSGELQQEWDDYKLRFLTPSGHDNSFGLEGKRADRIKHHLWMPDITIANGLLTSASTGDDFLRIDIEGHVTWTKQIFYEFPCEFDLEVYPLGAQECEIKLQSIGYDIKELEPQWADENAVLYDTVLPPFQYEIEEIETSSLTVVTFHRAKRQLVATVTLESLTEWVVRHTILPFVATVTIAYLSFFINVRAVSARMTTCCMAFLIACIFNETTYRNAPQSQYTMAIEVFTGTCMTFIWLAAVETVVVDILAHLTSKGPPSVTHNSMTLEHPDDMYDRGETAALWVDRCFRILYPTVFLVFNAIFWIIFHP